MNVFQLLIICGTIISSFQNVRTSPTVQINASVIVGQQVRLSNRKVNQYLGIPYAQPPVGPLRFKKPQSIQSYVPEFQAITNPPACPQYTTQPYPWYINSSKKSEDCLYLNIWTPADASPTNQKAVFFWIHGGGFRYGSIRDKLYSGIPMAALGDVIVVTVNHRLGPFGFLDSGSEDAPPNVGLWDILEGLKWVNQHIEAFGGDSDRITIGGESAGAFSVGYLTISPFAEGLYTRLIMESGSPVNHLAHENTMNIALAQQLAKNVECANDSYSIANHPKEVVQCLRSVDADTLSKADFVLVPDFPVSFFAQWGDELLPEEPRKTVLEGNFRCKDLLIGDNKDEGSLFVTTGDPNRFGFFGKKSSYISKALGRDIIRESRIVSSLPDSQSVPEYYLPANLTEDSHEKIRHQTYDALGDTLLTCPDVYYADKCEEQNKNVYYYYFTHRPSVTPWAEWMGAAHFEEVQFVFGKPILNPDQYEPSEVFLSHQIIDIWSDFVKHGKPNISWPLYSRENPSLKYLGPDNITEENVIVPHLKNCNFLRPFF